MQGRFLLKPTEELRSIIIGVLAKAQKLYPVDLHSFVFLSNHYHLLLSVDNALQLARFMNYLNSNLAREAGRLFKWREKFWGRRYQAIVSVRRKSPRSIVCSTSSPTAAKRGSWLGPKTGPVPNA